MIFLPLVVVLSLGQVPTVWSCGPALYGDGICDCGCAAKDSDCATLKFAVCVRSNCTNGQVPWEHQNFSCMASTCGDGWKADNEVCDDGNALPSGGCNFNCSAVNPGFVCGNGATGCTAGTPDAGTPDAGTPDAGTPDAGTTGAGGGTGGGQGGSVEGPKAGGCSSGPGGLWFGLALLFLGTRRVAIRTRP